METYKQNPCPSHRDNEFFCLIEATTMIVILRQLSTEYTSILDHVYSLTSPTSLCYDTLLEHTNPTQFISIPRQCQQSKSTATHQRVDLSQFSESQADFMGAICDSGQTRTLFYRRDSFFKMFMHDRKKLSVDLYIKWLKLNQKGKAGFTHREIAPHPPCFCAILIFCWLFMDLPSHV